MHEPEEFGAMKDAPFSGGVYVEHERAWKRAWFLRRSLLRLSMLSILGLIPLVLLLGFFTLPVYLAWVLVMWGSQHLAMRIEIPALEPSDDPRAPFLFLRPFGNTALKKRPQGVMRSGVHRLKITHNLAEMLERRQCLGRVLVLQEERSTTTTPSWTGHTEEDPPDLLVLREDDSNWFETIDRLAPRCRAILVLPGAGTGITREIALLRSRQLLERVLVLMPPVSRAFWRHEKEWRRLSEGWSDVQRELDRELGLQLPDYDAEGMLYRPNPDFSVRDAHPLGARLQGLHDALKLLTTVRDDECTSLGEILSELGRQGFESELGNVFRRDTVAPRVSPLLEREMESIGDLAEQSGTSALEFGSFEDAAVDLKLATELAPDDDQRWGWLAAAYHWGGNAELAQPAYRRALELGRERLERASNDPEPALLANLANYAAKLGERESSLELVDRAIALGPRNARVLATIAECLVELGEPEQAHDWLERALAAGLELGGAERHPGLRGLSSSGRDEPLQSKCEAPADPQRRTGEPDARGRLHR